MITTSAPNKIGNADSDYSINLDESDIMESVQQIDNETDESDDNNNTYYTRSGRRVGTWKRFIDLTYEIKCRYNGNSCM